MNGTKQANPEEKPQKNKTTSLINQSNSKMNICSTEIELRGATMQNGKTE
uniref:Uncharacterized protein n=1 Tax=Rhizophora mucronata TaxID=61149 RepID=A0A2P2JU94_RHIMU